MVQKRKLSNVQRRYMHRDWEEATITCKFLSVMMPKISMELTHNIYGRTVSSLCLFSALLNCFKLLYGLIAQWIGSISKAQFASAIICRPRKLRFFKFLDANPSPKLESDCSFLTKNENFNFPGLQMIAKAHFVPRLE